MHSSNHLFFLFGGTFLNSLQSHLQPFGTIAGRMTGISPLSQVSLNHETKNLTDWLPELDAKLEKTGAEYCILDLQQARQNLLLADGCYISASAQSLDLIKEKEIAVVDPVAMLWDEVEKAIDRFIRVLTKHFSGKKIILIHTSHPTYHLEGNNLREQKTFSPSAAQKKRLGDLENYFREKTGCHYVDVTRFYFYFKEPGRPLTDVIFEKRCYEDVAGRIETILAGGDGSAERPDFALSLDRYADYYLTLQKKPQRIFLDADRLPDKLVLSASDTFVRKHRDALIALDALDWNEPEKALEVMGNVIRDDVLVRVFRAFWAADNGRYGEQSVDYAEMFRSEVVPERLLDHLKREYAPEAGLLPAQINRYNAGVHYAKYQGLDPKPFATKLTVERPTVIDIFGSCISRTMFNVVEHDFAVNRYWFHVTPFEHRNKPYQYDPGLFPEKLKWTDRLVKQQLDGTIYQDVRDAEGEWLLVDLYALVSPNNFRIDDCIYGDFDHRISTLLKAQKVDLYRDSSVIGDHDQLIAALDPWLEVIAEKYGKKIIVVDGQRMDHWIGDDDRLYRVKKPHDSNAFWDRAAEYVCRKLDCYRVRVGRHFLPDELGYMRNTPAHKETLGYVATHDVVRYIVDHQPKTKCFDRYAGQIQMRHLERLVRKNEPAVLGAALPLSVLDKAVIRLGYEAMVKWHDELAMLYDSCDWDQPLGDILRDAAPDPSLERALRLAAMKPEGEEGKPIFNYPRYPAKAEVIFGNHTDCVLPKFPEIGDVRVNCDKDAVQITWSAPQNQCVQIFRRGEDTPWERIGESDTGAFLDPQVRLGAQFWYRLGVKVLHEGRHYLGGFTEPKSARVGIGNLIRSIWMT